MRSWVLAASLMAAAVTTGAQAADLYDGPPPPPERYGAYEDQRYADIYRYPAPPPYAVQPRPYAPYYAQPLPRERVYRDDDYGVEPKYLPGPRRYSGAEPPPYAERCVPREVVKDRLLRSGW